MPSLGSRRWNNVRRSRQTLLWPRIRDEAANYCPAVINTGNPSVSVCNHDLLERVTLLRGREAAQQRNHRENRSWFHGTYLSPNFVRTTLLHRRGDEAAICNRAIAPTVAPDDYSFVIESICVADVRARIINSGKSALT